MCGVNSEDIDQRHDSARHRYLDHADVLLVVLVGSQIEIRRFTYFEPGGVQQTLPCVVARLRGRPALAPWDGSTGR